MAIETKEDLIRAVKHYCNAGKFSIARKFIKVHGDKFPDFDNDQARFQILMKKREAEEQERKKSETNEKKLVKGQAELDKKMEKKSKGNKKNRGKKIKEML